MCAVTGKVRYRDGHDVALALKAARRRRALAERYGAEQQIRVCRSTPARAAADGTSPARPLPPRLKLAPGDQCWVRQVVHRGA